MADAKQKLTILRVEHEKTEKKRKKANILVVVLGLIAGLLGYNTYDPGKITDCFSAVVDKITSVFESDTPDTPETTDETTE